jgi:hypothetical protein
LSEGDSLGESDPKAEAYEGTGVTAHPTEPWASLLSATAVGGRPMGRRRAEQFHLLAISLRCQARRLQGMTGKMFCPAVPRDQ